MEEELNNMEKLQDAPLQRRLTLPNIVKCKDLALEKESRVGGKNQLPGKITPGKSQERLPEAKLKYEKDSEANVIIRDGGRREMVKEEENKEVEKGINFIDVDEGWFENKPRVLQTVMKTYQVDGGWMGGRWMDGRWMDGGW